MSAAEDNLNNELLQELSNLKKEANGDKALELLHIASYFAPGEIEIDLFSDLLGGTESLNNAVELIRKHSLLQSAHELLIRNEVQELLRQQDKERLFLKSAVELLSKHIISGRAGVLDHAISALNAVKEYPELMLKTSKFPLVIISGLTKLDRNSDAYAFGRTALECMERSIGAYHESTCCVQWQLGLVLVILRREHEGLKVLSESYQRFSLVSGQRPIDKNLEFIAQTKSGMTTDPESDLRRLAFGDATVSETNNNTDLSRWCEYAMMLSDLKWKDQALGILVQVLTKRLELLSPNDDDISRVLEHIGDVHMKRGEFRDALHTFQKALEKRRTVLGENCITTHHTRRAVAIAYDALGMLDEAVVEYTAAAFGIRSISGGEAISYLSTISRVAFIMLRQRNFEGAYDIYSRIYTDFVRIMGDEGVQTVNIKYHVGRVLLSRNKTAEGLKAWKGLLPEDVEVVGPTSSNVVVLIQNMCILTLYRNILATRI